jgi:hypothetical protein
MPPMLDMLFLRLCFTYRSNYNIIFAWARFIILHTDYCSIGQIEVIDVVLIIMNLVTITPIFRYNYEYGFDKEIHFPRHFCSFISFTRKINRITSLEFHPVLNRVMADDNIQVQKWIVVLGIKQSSRFVNYLLCGMN